MPEPRLKLVQNAERRPVYSGSLASGVQLRAAPQLAGLPHAYGVQTCPRRKPGHGPASFANHNHQPKSESPVMNGREKGGRSGNVLLVRDFLQVTEQTCATNPFSTGIGKPTYENMRSWLAPDPVSRKMLPAPAKKIGYKRQSRISSSAHWLALELLRARAHCSNKPGE